MRRGAYQGNRGTPLTMYPVKVSTENPIPQNSSLNIPIFGKNGPFKLEKDIRRPKVKNPIKTKQWSAIRNSFGAPSPIKYSKSCPII
jgi:hypothetical protein